MALATQILWEKRKQLEQEIAEFTSKKEEEYRSYERQYLMNSQSGNEPITVEAAPSNLRSSGNLRHQGNKDAHKPTPPLNDDTEKTVSTEGGDLVMVDGQAKANDPIIRPSSLAHNASTESLSFSQLHERELEFQGLFTPSFLPLLGGQGASSTKDKHMRRRSADMPSFPTDRQTPSASNQQGTASFSSSATFSTTQTQSSPSTRPLSASVPRQPSHHRRTSSRSDLSITSLRSSLRDPNQSRSPKRVLFSLNNEVVSPSSSPAAQRKTAGQDAGSSETFNAPQPLSSFGLGAICDGNGSDRFGWCKDFPSSSSLNGTCNGKFAPISASTRPPGYADAKSTTVGDDFESIDVEDELFAFDEDVGHEIDIKTEVEDDLGSEDDEPDGEPLTASSPHAGSLPIEIKWPARLGPKT